MGINGLLTDVRWQWTGTEITADLLANETVLPVLDPESVTTGEFIWVAGTGVYEIVAVDVDAATFTIEPGLEIDVDSGTEVARDIGGEPGQMWVCEVVLPDAERPIEVPLTVHDLAVMREGPYNPPVAIILSDDLDRVEDLPGSKPGIDGGFLLPDTVPVQPTTDGLAPTESPAMTLAPLYSTFLAHWPAQDNPDLVGYEVWLSAADVAAGEVGLTYSTNFHVTAEPNGSPLRRNVDYTLWVRAFDADGHAPAGTPATSRLTSITPADIEQAVLDSIEQAQIDASQALTDAAAASDAADALADEVAPLVKNFVVEYAVSNDEINPPSTGWSSDTPDRIPGEFIWTRTTVTHQDGTSATTSPALLTGNDGMAGADGADGADGPAGPQGPQGPAGSQGIPGPAGADGQTLYTWLKYADTPTTGMSDSPTGKTYMGLATNKTSATESSTYSDYTWSLIQGPQGTQGVPGPAGADGQPTYTWVKYGTSAAGAGLSDDPTGKTYIGLAYNKNTATESTNAADYQWALIQGPQGPAGPQGLQGIQGSAGTNGTNGASLFTWLKYADTPTTGMSDSPTGKTYMGIAYNKTTATESSTYSDYEWSLIQGPQGPTGAQGNQGIQGPAGADGQPTYTWVKYADNATGTSGFSDTPGTHPYVGFAFNKTTATESSDPALYQWSLIQGPQGQTGAQGPQGGTGPQGPQGGTGPQGVSVTSITPFFAQTADGAAAPAQPGNVATPPDPPWKATQPAFAAATDLYTTERVAFSNGTYSYTPVVKSQEYEAALTAWLQAQQATTDAFNANQAAGLAQTTANGRSRVWYLPNAPAGTSHKLDDVWFDTDDGYKPYSWDGDSWEPKPWGHQSIATLDAGKIVVGFLAAARIAANTIGVQHLAIADQTNLWPDPYFTLIKNDAGALTVRMSSATWASTPVPPAGGNVAVLNNRDHIATDSFAVKPGDEFLIEVTYRYTSGSAVFLAGLWQEKVDGSNTTVVSPWANGKREQLKDAAGVSIPDVDLGGGWFRQSLVVQINPAATDCARAALWLQIEQAGVSGTVVPVSDIAIRRRGKGSLLVDGAVSARQVGADVITANESYAKEGYIGVFKADQIGTGFLNSAVTLSGEMKTSDTGQRVVMDGQGLHLFSPTDVPLVDLPTDPTKPVSIKNVEAEVEGLTVKTSLSIQTAGTVAAGAGLELVGGVLAPSTSPGVVLDHDASGVGYYPTIPTSTGSNYVFFEGVAYDAAGTYAYVATNCNNIPRVDKINTATGASVASLQFGTTQDIHGIAVDPATGKVWVELTEYTGSTRKIVRYDTSLVYEATSPHLGYYQGFTGLDMDIVSGVAYCGLRYTAGNAPYVLAVNLTTFAVTAYTGTPNLGTSGHGFAASTFDFGDGILRFVFTDNVNARVFYLSSGTTLTERPNDNFPLGSDTGPSGTIVATDNLAHFGNEFRQFAHSRLSTPNATTQVFPWKKFTGINWTTETSQWWASYTWRDSDGTTHQTDQGKRAAFTMAKRSRIRLTSAAIPDFGGVDDPNAVSFYLGRNPTDPTRTGMWLHGGTLGDGVTSLDLTAVSFAGTNPPANNDFPGSTPGYIKSGAKRADGTPKVKVDGLGVANVDGLIPPGSVQMWAGVSASPPTGWVFCNGTSTPLNTAVYPDLFAAIGYTYGGSGTTFYPPNFNDKMPIGAGGARALGATGGAETKPVPAHTHTTNLASHTHFAGTYATNSTGSSHDHGNGSLAANTLNDRASGSGGRATATITGRTGTDGSAHTHGFAGESGGVVGANPDMTSSQPSGSAFDIMPPWLALKFIIKL